MKQTEILLSNDVNLYKNVISHEQFKGIINYT